MKTFLLPAEAADDIELAGGRVIVGLGPNLIVAELPDATGLPVVTEEDIERLDSDTALLASSWYESERLTSTHADEPVVPWDEWEKAPPKIRPDKFSGYRSDFNGKVAVGVYLVSGPGDLKVSDADCANTRTQIVRAMTRTAQLNPLGRLTMQLDPPQIVQISAKPRKCDSYTDCEKVWMGDVLRALHVGDTDDLIKAVAVRNKADRAYIAFFTKYPKEHFAYSYWGMVFMEFKNGGWGPGDIWKVFVHESMHVFYAFDEYKKAAVACSERDGAFQAANCNSLTCGGKKLTCVMNANTPVVCTWSRRQVGWDGASPQLRITDVNKARTTEAPALVQDPGKRTLYMFFRGDDAGVLWMCSRPGAPTAGWSAQQKVLPGGEEVRTRSTPAAVMHEGRCFVAYTGSSGSGNLYVTGLDGSAWSTARRVTTGIGAGPALASYRGELTLVARGKSGELLSLTSNDGSTWSKPERILNVRTSSQPAAAVYAGMLFVAYREPGDSGKLSFVTFDGTIWAGPIRLTDINGARTAHGPALAPLGDDLLVFWQGVTDDPHIWTSAINLKPPSAAMGFSRQLSITDQNSAQCGHSLAASGFATGVQLGYRGVRSHNVWTCHYAANAPRPTDFAVLWQGC